MLANFFGRTLTLLVFVAVSATSALAGGPRWVSGPPYFNNWYATVSWYNNHPQYFTDPGDLSSTVNHAAADAMVAQAAAVWNIPTASLNLAQGGNLNEHVSQANVTASSTGLIFPIDVQTSNYLVKQIAIIYDTDGSVTDLLLGTGASDPSGCLQTGVTESVDGISIGAQIYHAILILNGRCTGSAPEQQLQMQYQLVRAFGRILGLGWSQTNDNVFTGSPTPSITQAQNWPIMHPIDILCGPYSYQCLPNPFTLRPDDISALEQLYFIPAGQAAQGKTASWTNAGGAYGYITFPNGQGMEGVNVVVRRRAPFWDTAETWETVSAVSGLQFRSVATIAVVAPSTSAAGSLGVNDSNKEGYWRIQSIPVPPSEAWTDMVISTQAINPLYTGPYSVGAIAGNTIAPSGSSQTQVSPYLANGRDNLVTFTPPDAAATCPTQADGTEAAPALAASNGWSTGILCGYKHHAWSSVSIKANRSLTVELTALDENGNITLTKAMPIVGAWKSTDPTGTLPTVAVITQAFNSLAVGVTTLPLQASAATTFRLAIVDQRGAGRPDFAYQVRTLYADTVAPATVPAAGGTITITGMGFRQGMTVLINSAPAIVLSTTATIIVATAPSFHTLGLTRAASTSITVQDPSTGGSSLMSSALAYTAPVEALNLITAPAATIAAGQLTQNSLSVQAIAPDGFTPIVGEPVTFTATGTGSIRLSPCAAATCTVLTNASGLAITSITPTAQGVVNLTATGRSGSVTTSFTTTAPNTLHLITAPTTTATTGTAAATPVSVQLLSPDGTTPIANTVVTLAVTAGTASLGACASTPCTLTTNASGMVTTTILPTSTGTVALSFSTNTSTVTASITAAPETMQRVSTPSATQTVGTPFNGAFAVRILAGDGVTPVTGEAVVFSAAGANVTFNACNGSVCTLTTDAQGLAQSTVTPTAAGAITLSAAASAGSATAAVTAIALPNVLHPFSIPAGPVVVGNVAPASFTVRITKADNITPVAGQTVTFTATSGTVLFGICAAPTCTVVTDATGTASTSVSPTSAGPIALAATAQVGSSTAAFTATARQRSVTPAQAIQYVAAGASISWTPKVTLADNGASTTGIPVTWTGSTGFLISNGSTVSNTSAVATTSAQIGPLAAGTSAQATACAWTNLCSSLTAQAVGSDSWRLTLVSGAGQSVATGSALGNVLVRVTDAIGNPVAGAPVQIIQTVSNWQLPCTGSGRCAVASILLATTASATSDLNGLVSLTPAQVANAPSNTSIAVIAGTQGQLTLSLETHP